MIDGMTTIARVPVTHLTVLAVTFIAVGSARVCEAAKERTWEAALAPGDKLPQSAALRAQGKQIYGQACFFCHGASGDGQGTGADYLPTKPRNFTTGQFKVRTTPSGSLPRDEDLFRTISRGFPDYGMPSFEHLNAAERWALVYFIESFSPRFGKQSAPKALVVGQLPAATPELLAQGKALYEQVQCWKCHGHQGHADGPSAWTLKDDAGHPTRTPNFAHGRRALKRGSRPRDIMATLLTGMDGSPMPSYADTVNEEQAQALAHYVATLIDGAKQ